MTAIQRLGRRLEQRGLCLVTAESCTAGLLASTCADVPGASAWLEGGFVTYTLHAKQKFLGVSEATLDRWGAVSEPTAREMALGALARSDADLSVSVTGIAGPDGGDIDTPVGTVWLGWALREDAYFTAARYQFEGTRADVRSQVVDAAIDGLLELLR